MLLSEDRGDAKFRIKSYDNGKFIVNDSSYQNSIIITPNQLIEHWAPQSIEELKEEDLFEIKKLSPSVVLLGTGEHFIMPKPYHLKLFQHEGIGIECMDTRAACRTFLALASEGRNVAAALLIK